MGHLSRRGEVGPDDYQLADNNWGLGRVKKYLRSSTSISSDIE
jgi:hypothetical protein